MGINLGNANEFADFFAKFLNGVTGKYIAMVSEDKVEVNYEGLESSVFPLLFNCINFLVKTSGLNCEREGKINKYKDNIDIYSFKEIH